jgi:hypothetical protein
MGIRPLGSPSTYLRVGHRKDGSDTVPPGADPEEFTQRIPLRLREKIDGRQSHHLPAICELIARHLGERRSARA